MSVIRRYEEGQRKAGMKYLWWQKLKKRSGASVMNPKGPFPECHPHVTAANRIQSRLMSECDAPALDSFVLVHFKISGGIQDLKSHHVEHVAKAKNTQ